MYYLIFANIYTKLKLEAQLSYYNNIWFNIVATNLVVSYQAIEKF